jgi:hypothetical protein
MPVGAVGVPARNLVSHETRSNTDSMKLPLRKSWTREEFLFLAWAERQTLRYEFDGTQPIAMTGGDAAQSLIMRGLHRALDVPTFTSVHLPFSRGLRL